MLNILPAFCIAFGVASILLSIRRYLLIRILIEQSNNLKSQNLLVSLFYNLLSLDVCLLAAFSLSFAILSFIFNFEIELFKIIIPMAIYLLLIKAIDAMESRIPDNDRDEEFHLRGNNNKELKQDILRFIGNQYLMVFICILFVISSDLYLISHDGFLGLNSLNLYESAFIAVAICLVVILSFNSISRNFFFFHSIAIYISLSLGIIFLSTDDLKLFLISLLLTGALFSFRREDILYSQYKRTDFNIIVGLFISYLIISYLNKIQISNANNYFSNPILLLAVLIIPFSELLKAAVVGYLNKFLPSGYSDVSANLRPVSLFQKFLSIGISPRRSVRSIIAINLLIVLFTLGFSSVSPLILSLFIIIFIVMINLMLDIKIKRIAHSNVSGKNVSFVEELNITSSEN